MGGTASAAANDVSNTINYNSLPPAQKQRHSVKTEATRKRNAEAEEYYRNDDPPASQSAPPRAAPAPNYGIGAVAAAPSVPNPDAIGETEQALLDQQKKGRSSTIATSAKGLLSGDDDTRKKRSLMGSLIT